MSIKCKVGDVVRVYRHHVKKCVGLIGEVVLAQPVAESDLDMVAVNIKGDGFYYVPRHYLAHVRKETTVIAGFHENDMYLSYNGGDGARERVGKEVILVKADDPCEEGYFTGKVTVPTLQSEDYYYAALLHTYNKGKK